MLNSLGRPPKHLEGTLKVQKGIAEKFEKGSWKDRFVLVLKHELIIYEGAKKSNGTKKIWKNFDLTKTEISDAIAESVPQGYSVNWTFRLCCDDDSWTFLAVDSDDYKSWFDGLLYVKKFWVARMNTNKAPNRVSEPLNSDEFHANVIDINGCRRGVRVKKDARFSDFYKVWTGDDEKKTRSSRSSFHALKEKGVQLWRVDKIHGESMIRKTEEIYPYVEEGCQLFLLEKSYKLIVIFFDDGDVVAAPVQPTITTAQVAELPLIMEKLAEKDLLDCQLLIKRNLDTGIEVSLKDDDKPMEIFYRFEHGVGRRNTDVNAKLIYRKRTKTDSKEKETQPCAITNIPKDAPDLLPVHRTPNERGKSPIQAMFSGLLKKTMNPIESCQEKSIENMPSSSAVTSACAEADGFEASAPKASGHSHVLKESLERQTNMPENTPIDSYRQSCIIHGPVNDDVNAGTDSYSPVCTEGFDSTKVCHSDTGLPDDSREAIVQGTEANDKIECVAVGVDGEIEVDVVDNHTPTDDFSSRSSPIVDKADPEVHEEASIVPAIMTPDDISKGGGDVADQNSNMGKSAEDHVPCDQDSNIAILSNNSFVVETKRETEQLLGDSHVNADVTDKEEAQDNFFVEGHAAISAVCKHDDFTPGTGNIEVKSPSELAKQIRDLTSPVGQDLQSLSRLKDTENRSGLQTGREFPKPVSEKATSYLPKYCLEVESGPRVIAAQVHVGEDIKRRGIPVVGEKEGMILPTLDQLAQQKTSESHHSTSAFEATGILQVNDGKGASSGGQVLPRMSDSASPQDSGLGGSSCDNNDVTDDYDSDSSDSSSVMSIESAMESLGQASYKSEEKLYEINTDHSQLVANVDVGADSLAQTAASGSQQQLIGEIADTSSAPKEQSVYDSNDKKDGSTRGRKGAFRGNAYEKEVTIERLRRRQQERMEEEAKQKEEEARFVEAKREAAKLEEAKLEEARYEQAKLQEARLEEGTFEKAPLEQAVGQAAEQEEHSRQIMELGSKQNSLLSAASMNGSIAVSDSGLEKRPPSSSRNRAPCPTCQICNVKPFQVLKFKQMNDVLRMSQDSGYNYLCLSGVHIKKVDGVWILTDSTVFHTESELTDSLDSISLDRSSGNMGQSGSIASKVKKEKNIKLNGGICCHWIPRNGGKWRVTQFAEDHLQPVKSSEDERLRPIPSPCFGASATNIDAGKRNHMAVTSDNHTAAGRFNGMGNALSRKVKSTYREVNASVKDVFASQKPSQEMYLPLEILQFSERYVTPLGRIVGAIGQQFSDACHRFPQQIGDDSVNTDLGWLIRRDLCTALFSLILHDVKRDNSMTRLLMGRTNKFSLWSLIKDVARACVEESVLQNLVIIIQQSPLLFDDDLRARNFVCETLNWYNEAFTEKLLITWLRTFVRLQHIIDKYFEKSSIWKRPSREVAAVAHQTFSILSQLNQFHFNLHADFEHKQLALRVRDQNLAFILQREPKSIDINVATME